MFHQLEREFSTARWLVQLVAVYCGPVLLFALIESTPQRPLSPAISDVAAFPFVALIGLLAGVGIQRLAPDSAREGAWVWLLPSCVLALFLLCDRFSSVSDFSGFFYAPAGDPDPVPVILTTATWGCCWYSAAIYWRRRSRRRAASLNAALTNTHSQSSRSDDPTPSAT